MLDTAIGNIEEEEYDFQRSSKGNQLGVTTDSEGNLVSGADGGQYTLEQKSSVSKHQKGRSPERVAAVFDNVMRNPKVMAYLQRKAEIHAAQLEGKEGEYLSQTSERIDKELVKLDTAIAEEKDSDTATMLEAQRGQLEEMKSEVAEAIENPELASELIEELDKNHRIQEYKDQYLTSYGIMNTTVDKETSSQILGYDKVWLQDEKLRKKNELDYGLQMPVMTISGETMEYIDPMGDTYETSKATIKAVDDSMESLQEDLQNVNLSESTREQYEREYNVLAARKATYVERFTQEFEGMSPDMLDNPEYLRLKENVKNAGKTPSTTASSGGTFGMGTSVPFTQSSVIEANQALLNFMEGNGLNTSTEGSVNYAPTITSNHMPGLSQKQQAVFKNQLNALFTNGMTGASNLMVFPLKEKGEMQTITNGTEDMVTIQDARDNNLLPDDATMESYGVIAVNPMGGSPMIQVNWTSEDEGNSGSLYVPIQQGSIHSLGPGVDQYLNSSYMSIMTSIEGGQWNKKNTATIPYHVKALDENGVLADVPNAKGAIHVRYERNDDGSIKKKMATFVNDDGTKSKEYDVTNAEFESILINGDGGNQIIPDSNYR
jgi:hypothetical protein